MVKWTDFERATIKDIFSKIDYDVVGPAALSRCLVVYPWTQRYFGSFGNLYKRCCHHIHPKVAAHGRVGPAGPQFADLSVLHSEKLQVDPGNFKIICCKFYQKRNTHKRLNCT
uniref:Globin domain-containing protein n=1 Tax=Salarias fasciatus TaxID=181472 RepID=A0A672FM49_SALFA